MSSSIFWSSMTEETTLPGSVRGKLGGRSQRRLSTSTTTAILQAVCFPWFLLFKLDLLLKHEKESSCAHKHTVWAVLL